MLASRRLGQAVRTVSYSGGDPIRFTSFSVISFYLPWREQSWRLSSSRRDAALEPLKRAAEDEDSDADFTPRRGPAQSVPVWHRA
jgi:hypothetical protein